MIIHNPIISGSIQFPADADGNKVTLQVNSGVLETIQIDSSNNATAVKPESNLSGSFTGSFQGDGSALTGVSAINIDALNALGGATVAQGDNLVISDGGTEKKITFSNFFTSNLFFLTPANLINSRGLIGWGELINEETFSEVLIKSLISLKSIFFGSRSSSTDFR